MIDKSVLPHYDKQQQRQTDEKEEYSESRTLQRAAGGGIAVLHWKWNGLSRAVLNFQYGLTATAVVKRAADMLVYEKSGPKGQIEWHRGYEIRLKDQILNRYLILGIFFYT